MKVLKFGGTSVGSIESIQKVIEIISGNLKNKESIAVVYSAMGGVTNKLIEAGQMAAKNDTQYLEILKNIEERHFTVIRALVDVKSQSSIIAKIKGLFNELEDLLKGITYLREISNRTSDLLVSFGERLSTQIIAYTLQSQGIDSEYIDAREVIKTNSNYG